MPAARPLLTGAESFGQSQLYPGKSCSDAPKSLDVDLNLSVRFDQLSLEPASTGVAVANDNALRLTEKIVKPLFRTLGLFSDCGSAQRLGTERKNRMDVPGPPQVMRGPERRRARHLSSSCWTSSGSRFPARFVFRGIVFSSTESGVGGCLLARTLTLRPRCHVLEEIRPLFESQLFLRRRCVSVNFRATFRRSLLWFPGWP